MNEAEIQAKLERVEQLTTKLSELVNRFAATADEVTILLQSVTELLDDTQEPKQSATKENAKMWYRLDLISLQTMSMADFCKHTSFLEECNRLKVSPKFENMLTQDGVRHVLTTSVCILKDVTVSEDWLTQHATDSKRMAYNVGDLPFYIGTRFTCLGEH